MKRLPPEIRALIKPIPGGAAGVEPSWQETSVRWLRANHTEYVRTGALETAVFALSRALGRMSYGKVSADEAGMTRKQYEESCDSAAALWVRSDHEEMLAWLKKGGYLKEMASKKPTTALPALPVVENEGTTEEIEGLVNGLAAPQLEITLDEIVADAERDDVNPDHGSW